MRPHEPAKGRAFGECDGEYYLFERNTFEKPGCPSMGFVDKTGMNRFMFCPIN